MGNKGSQFETSKRVGKVYDMMAMGSTRIEIVQFVMQEYDVHVRTADNYIKAANKLFASDSHYDRAQELGRAISRLNTLYSKNMGEDDFGGALAVQKEINKLLGLHEPIKIDIQIVLAVVQKLEALQIDPVDFFKKTMERLE